MQISTQNNTGEVALHPLDNGPARPGWTIREVTPAIQTVLDQGGPFRWEPQDADSPEGSGTLIKTDAPPPPVPAEIEPAQLREWLIRSGRLPAVEAALEAIPDAAEKAVMKAWFEFAVKIRRANPKVAMLAQALGMSDAQVDDAFREAAKF